jgi:hypothetical protein
MIQKRIDGNLPFTIFIGLEVLIIAVSILLEGLSLEALHVTTRFSGRLSLLFFSLFLISREKIALKKLVSDTPFFLFAIIHGIHLIELLWYVRLSGNELIPVRLAGGFLAYVIIFVMPFLHAGNFNQSFIARFQTFYFVYVWFIFFMSYLPRVTGTLPNVGGSYTEFVVLFIWIIILGLYKLLFSRKLIPVKNH